MADTAIAAAVRAVAARLGRPPRVVTSGNAAVPHELLRIVDETLPEYHLFVLNAPHGIPVRPGVTLETPFVGPGMRRQPGLRYIPARLSQVPRLFGTTCPPDIVCVQTSRAERGRISLGIEVNILPAAVEAARARGGLVLVQANSRMPYTFGDAELPVTDVDAMLDVDLPIPEWGTGGAAPTRPDVAAIGRAVAARVTDGATLQLGIGEVPDAALAGLLGRESLGVWSEMVSDGVVALDRAGALDRGRLVVTSFVAGTADLYEWAHHNERLRLLRTETVNDPSRIAANDRMVSVNTALEVDLFGQANASRIAARIHSGFGGQSDFVVGALHSPGGQALMALRSWHPKADVSTIVPLLDEPVTSFQHSAVITEQGTATIWGNDERSQAAELIDHAAHPRVRAELWEEARALGLAD